MNTIIKSLRYIGAIIVPVIVSFLIVRFGSMIGSQGTENESLGTLLGSSIFGGMAYAFLVFKIAPANNKRMMIVMTYILCGWFALSFLCVSGFYLLPTIRLTLTAAGAIGCCVAICKKK